MIVATPLIGQQSIDNSSASSVIPWTLREDFPGRCKPGQKTTISTGTAGSNDYTCGNANDWHLIGATSITSYTIATLPGSAASGTLAVVTDAASAGSCVSGSGSALSLCRWSGSAWATVGGAGSSGTTINVYTVATLPATPASNLFAMVTDASPAGSCSAGGGAGKSLCFSSGSAWGPVGAVIDASAITTGVLATARGGTGAGVLGPGLRKSNGASADTVAVAADVPTLNQNTTGNAATATALATLPTPCSAGSVPTGVLANGNSTGCVVSNPLHEIGFSLCANLNCLVGDTITVPRNVSASTAGTLQKCSVRFGTAPTASTTIDVRKNGSGSPIATITAAAATANTTTFTNSALVENDYLTLVITAVGATPGKDANIICTVQ